MDKRYESIAAYFKVFGIKVAKPRPTGIEIVPVSMELSEEIKQHIKLSEEIRRQWNEDSARYFIRVNKEPRISKAEEIIRAIRQ